MQHGSGPLSSLPVLFVAFAAVSAASAQTLPGAALDQDAYPGHWLAPFDHDLAGFQPKPKKKFNAVHMALIPRGPHRGKVVVFNEEEHVHEEGEHDDGHAHAFLQHWAVVDVAIDGAPEFLNSMLRMPEGGGNLFCAGLSWTADGNLFVAGGTTQYYEPQGEGEEPDPFIGANLAYLYDPTDSTDGRGGTWTRMPDLEELRWYPTIKLLPDGRMIVAGGISVHGSGHAQNHYEVFVPAVGGAAAGHWEMNATGVSQVFPGPDTAYTSGFRFYPRLHLLSTGEMFLSSMGPGSATFAHQEAPGVFDPGDASFTRVYGSAVYFYFPGRPPGERDVVLEVGGRDGSPTAPVLRDVDAIRPAALRDDQEVFTPLRPMHIERMEQNAVVLPDASVFVFGGRRNGEKHEDFVYTPELWKDGRWRLLPDAASKRGYHATAVLLPDGRVLTAGANKRDWDYQVYVPGYLTTGEPRPEILSAPERMDYGRARPGAYALTLSAAVSGYEIDRAVLMRPGAGTHHFDNDQRYVGLVTATRGHGAVTVLPPFDRRIAPPGYYMLFLVSAAGVPSEAAWVLLE